MKSFRQRLNTLAAAALLGSIAIAASAQTAPELSPPPATMAPSAAPDGQQQAPAAMPSTTAPSGMAHAKRGQHGQRDLAERMAARQQHRAARLGQLKAKLQLTPAQEGAWTTFTASAQRPDHAKTGADWRERRAEMAKLTTPERLDRMQARQTERAAQVKQRAEATRTFYAELNPEQQKTFDAGTMRMGRDGHRHPHHKAGLDRQHGERAGHDDMQTKS